MDVAEYCRDIETYLCRKNEGHLIRIVGPSFETVSRWAVEGVPLKVAYAGIDRYFERYYRRGPRRRPVRIDFCEADVFDVFDEWRRATGIAGRPDAPSADVSAPARRGPSLPEHLERVLVRLSSLRATGVLGPDADAVVDAVSSELDVVRAAGASLRGERRRAALARLADLDGQLLTIVMRGDASAMMDAIRAEVAEDLVQFRAGMTPDAYDRALAAAVSRAVRERLRLPQIGIE
ncbi:MAG: hypothetical protein AB7Q29_03670 [Vicinamibacterales bacterium]